MSKKTKIKTAVVMGLLTIGIIYFIPVFAAAPVPSLTFNVDHDLNSITIPSGSQVFLSWESHNTSACSASANPSNTSGWFGARGLIGSEWTVALSTPTTFTLGCSGSDGISSIQRSVQVNIQGPSLSFTATGNLTSVTIPYNTGTTLNWSTASVDTCNATGDWSGTQSKSGTFNTGNLTSTRTYNLTCSNSVGSVTKSVTVNMQGPALNFTAGSGTSLTGQCLNKATNPPTCTTNSSACWDGSIFDFPRCANISVAVTKNSTIALNWNASNVASCTAAGDWSGIQNLSGTFTTPNITGIKEYKLTCSSNLGSVTKSIKISAPEPGHSSAYCRWYLANGNSWNEPYSCSNAGRGDDAPPDSVACTLFTEGSFYTQTKCGGGIYSEDYWHCTCAPYFTADAFTFSASPTSVERGGMSILSWSAPGASGCEASGSNNPATWPGVKPNIGSLSVGPLASSQSYTLKCTDSTNASGINSVTKTVTINVGSGGGTYSGKSNIVVNTGEASNITYTTATLNGSSGFSGTGSPPRTPLTGYFRYSRASIPPIYCNDIYGTNMASTRGVVLSNPRPFSENVTGLSPDTTYYYCAIVSNADSIAYGGQSIVKSFHTNPTRTTIRTTTATNIKPNSARMNGYFSAVEKIVTYFEYQKINADGTTEGWSDPVCRTDHPVETGKTNVSGNISCNLIPPSTACSSLEVLDPDTGACVPRSPSMRNASLEPSTRYQFRAVGKTCSGPNCHLTITTSTTGAEVKTFFGNTLTFLTSPVRENTGNVGCQPPFAPLGDGCVLSPESCAIIGQTYDPSTQTCVDTSALCQAGYVFSFPEDACIKTIRPTCAPNQIYDPNGTPPIGSSTAGLAPETGGTVGGIGTIQVGLALEGKRHIERQIGACYDRTQCAADEMYRPPTNDCVRKVVCQGCTVYDPSANRCWPVPGGCGGGDTGTGTTDPWVSFCQMNPTNPSCLPGPGWEWTGGGTTGDWTWKGGGWTGGTWTGGTWIGGTWTGGTWTGDWGTWTGGTWENGQWTGGEWTTGGWDTGTSTGTGTGTGTIPPYYNGTWTSGTGTGSGTWVVGAWTGTWTTGTGTIGTGVITWTSNGDGTGTWTSATGSGTWVSTSGIWPPAGATGTWTNTGTGTGTGTDTGTSNTGTWQSGNGGQSGTWNTGTGSGTWTATAGTGGTGITTWIDNGNGTGTWTSATGSGTWTITSGTGMGAGATGTWESRLPVATGDPGDGTWSSTDGGHSGVWGTGNGSGSWVATTGTGGTGKATWICLADGKGTWKSATGEGTWDNGTGKCNGEKGEWENLSLGIGSTPPDDAIVRYHEGIETVFIRQILRNPIYLKTYNKAGNGSAEVVWDLAHKFAKMFGYVSADGKEIRVSPPDIAAYRLQLIGNDLTVYEYYDGKIVDIRDITTVFKDKAGYEYYFQKK